MSRQLFSNVRDLYEQIDTQYNERSPEEGPGAQMAVSTDGASHGNGMLTDLLFRRFAFTAVASSHATCANTQIVSYLP
jgi:hypothetical protein